MEPFILSLIQVILQGLFLAIVAILVWIFKSLVEQIREVKTSILDLNSKIGQILVRMENHNVRLSLLERTKE